MKVVIFEVEPREAAAFDALGANHDLVVTDQPLQAGNASHFADAEVVSTFIYSKLDRDVLDQLPATKLVATRSTGYDHIDMADCARRKIAVCNVPTYGENTVAEHVFALLLALSHRLRDAMERARSGWFSPQGLEGFDLQGKTLGVIGTGNIGRHVIRIARGFLMDVVAFDAKPDPELEGDLGFRYVGFDELLSRSDIITLHVPASPQTQHLIGASAFQRMKRGAVIINTARGGLIDVIALVQALRTGQVAAAGLDVLPDEPLIREEAELISSAFAGQNDLRNLVAGHVLLNMPNVIVTPHSGFNTREAVARIIATTVDNIEAFAAGRPRNRVG
ncbi:hydroxyacid dehydrogenase [Rhodoblastus acidophilus]|uniref:Hydroxyacid dehydrogenase n=1 Tax=Rhodoblastus acidophilus TaxID=1074 RepID=A0A6N8DL14_RHOAC|nr:hydroxyacid dehydrogenase [Rhodoblastus acidophilus]MCW2273823.1 D-lactate dehydrogenase [Rhodoblastus acidophilus]MTV31028.1 hydroxyacid dehydrogenase [Rhodoblastus acidophilus]